MRIKEPAVIRILRTGWTTAPGCARLDVQACRAHPGGAKVEVRSFLFVLLGKRLAFVFSVQGGGGGGGGDRHRRVLMTAYSPATPPPESSVHHPTTRWISDGHPAA